MHQSSVVPGRSRYERRRRWLSMLPLLLALFGLCSRFVGQATADSGESAADAEYRSAQASISSAYFQRCGVTGSGGVKCWGYGAGGRLGDGTENTSYTPVDVIGLSSGVQAVTAGSDTSCAITSFGGAKCWGNRVGDGSANGSSTSPVDVLGMMQGVRQIDIGGGFTCFVTTSSDVRCLGDNNWAQLGDGTRTSAVTVSSVVQSLAGKVQSIATSSQATCAILLDATVQCWGYGGYGELGDGSYGIDSNNPYTPQPVAVVGLTSVVALAGGGQNMCALTSAGGVKCWGNNQFGQLGDGTTVSSPVPVDVVGLQSGVRTVTAGGYSACALLYSNEVQCWGRNDGAELGLGSTGGPVLVPTTVPGLSGTITAVSAGFYGACALNSTGELRCWGQVVGMLSPEVSPTLVPDFAGIRTRVVTPDAVVLLRGYYPTLFQTSQGVDSPVNLGVRVKTSQAGTITKVLFAKDISNTDAHTALIWNSAGVVLASQAFVEETAEGWQELTLSTPVHVEADETFTVGYSLLHTGYAYDSTFPEVSVGPLTIDSGYYIYSSNPTDFPSGTVGSNYGVDFEFMVDETVATTTTSTTTTTTIVDTTTTSTTTTIVDTTTTTSSTTTTTVPVTTTTSSTTTTTSLTTTTTSSTTTTVPVSSTTSTTPVAATTTTVAVAPSTTSSPTTTTTPAPESVTTTSLLEAEPSSTVASSAGAPADTTPVTSVPTAPPTQTPPVATSPDEQVALVAALESTDVSAEEIAVAVNGLIDAGITGTAATDLAASDKVLAVIDTTQAQAVFEAIPVSSLDEQQIAELSAALTDAPTEIKDTFEATIDVYGGGFDTYVPVDSVIDVGERKTLVAAMTAISGVAAVAATTRVSGGSSSGSGSREKNP